MALWSGPKALAPTLVGDSGTSASPADGGGEATIPPEILDRCPLALRKNFVRHVLEGGLPACEMQVLTEAADDGNVCAKAFLEAADLARAYLASQADVEPGSKCES